MTKRSSFRIAIKLFGLYSLILMAFYYIPWNIQLWYGGFDMWAVLWVLMTTIVIVLMLSVIVRKTDVLIDWLKLDRGFDDDRIDLTNFSKLNLVSLATIVLSGILIIDYLPSFLYNCYWAFKESVQRDNLSDQLLHQADRSNYFDWGIATLNLVLGYFLITNYQRVAMWINGLNAKERAMTLGVHDSTSVPL